MESSTTVVMSSLNNKSWVELVEEENGLAMSEPRYVPPGIITEEESVDVVIRSGEDDDDSCALRNVTLTYANIVRQSGESELPHEDISLSGHIEDFQLTSPRRSVRTPTRPTQQTASPLRSSPRNLKRRLLQEETSCVGRSPLTRDQALMPSPSKLSRSSDKTPVSLHGKKRPRDLVTPPSRRGGSGRKTPVEIETNEEVLARRQKQIDYGKNTIGYERYRKLVPKECRKSIHPRTPPMRTKYSRRGWEGLVRIWRQRLHFWDPPSEGGGDPTCLEGGDGEDMSDLSSTDGSLPSTPVQRVKRRHVRESPAVSPATQPSARVKHNQGANNEEEDDEDNGCTPLPP